MYCHQHKNRKRWLRTCAIIMLCSIVWSSIFGIHTVQKSCYMGQVFQAAGIWHCVESNIVWLGVIVEFSEKTRKLLYRDAYWKRIWGTINLWTGHVMKKDVFGYEGVVNERQWNYGGINLFSGWEASLSSTELWTRRRQLPLTVKVLRRA